LSDRRNSSQLGTDPDVEHSEVSLQLPEPLETSSFLRYFAQAKSSSMEDELLMSRAFADIFPLALDLFRSLLQKQKKNSPAWQVSFDRS